MIQLRSDRVRFIWLENGAKRRFNHLNPTWGLNLVLYHFFYFHLPQISQSLESLNLNWRRAAFESASRPAGVPGNDG